MSDKRKAQLARKGRWIGGRHVPQRQAARAGLARAGYSTTAGVEYFVSRGRGNWGSLPRNDWNGREQHLPAGIWARKGIHGSDVTPVFLVVRLPSYKIRLHFHAILTGVALDKLPKRFAAWVKYLTTPGKA